MAKKKDESKCSQCGHRVVLASTCICNVRVEPDQEPYTADIVEPVIVNGCEKKEIIINISATCHVCPDCGLVRDFTLESNM